MEETIFQVQFIPEDSEMKVLNTKRMKTKIQPKRGKSLNNNIGMKKGKSKSTEHYVLGKIKSENTKEMKLVVLPKRSSSRITKKNALNINENENDDDDDEDNFSDNGSNYQDPDYEMEEAEEEINIKSEYGNENHHNDKENEEGNIEEIYEHICGKCEKTYEDIERLKKHLNYCRMQQSKVEKPAEIDIAKIEREAAALYVDNICFCCEESFETCHSGHIRCYECPKSFKTGSSFERHIALLHHPKETYPCSTCNARCPTETILNFHEESHKLGKPFACKKCGKEFTRRYHLLRHDKFSLCGEPDEKKILQCNVCKKQFFRMDNLRNHLRQHMGDTNDKSRDYTCPFCEKSFYGTATLNIHIRTHTGERPFECDICQRKFPSNPALRKHRRSHTGERPYSCTVCPKAFAAKEVLNRHMKTHTGEKPHSCDLCGKSFIQAIQLRAHMEQHKKGKNHICEICDKFFSAKSLLNEHTKTHKSQNPNTQCEICHLHLPTKAGLSRHMGRKHKKDMYKCKICDEQLSDKTSFNFHMLLRHDDDESQKCRICGEEFSRKVQLIEHLRELHRPTLIPDANSSNNKKKQSNRKRKQKEEKEIRVEILNEMEIKEAETNEEEMTSIYEPEEGIEEYILETIPDNNEDELITTERTITSEEDNLTGTIKSTSQEEERENDKNEIIYELVEIQDEEVKEEREEKEAKETRIKTEAEEKKDFIFIMDEQTFEKNIRKLLDILVSKEILANFGWPKASTEHVLFEVIKNCGHKMKRYSKTTDYGTKMREYVKLLFTVVIDNDSIKELLNNHTIDEVIHKVLAKAKF